MGLYRLGGGNAHAAAERRETGKSTDLCSSLESGSEVSIGTKSQIREATRIRKVPLDSARDNR